LQKTTKYATLFLHKRKFNESGLVLPSAFLIERSVAYDLMYIAQDS
jgi:hypothetical protein